MLSLKTTFQSARLAASKGYTVVELLIVMFVGGIIVTSGFSIFNSLYVKNIKLQEDSYKYGILAIQAQRVSKVIRGAFDFTEATNDSITMYAYFSPRDGTMSKIRYYKDSISGIVYADVTPMTSNPPIGIPVTTELKTYTIVDNPNTQVGTTTFQYLDASGVLIPTPLANLKDIKAVRISLSVSATTFVTTKPTTIVTDVAIRNRKTNL